MHAGEQYQLILSSISIINVRKRKQEVVQKAKDDLAAEEEYSDDEEEEDEVNIAFLSTQREIMILQRVVLHDTVYSTRQNKPV